MIPDLAENPEAERSSPVRGIQQPILPKNALRGNGTTNSGVCEGGGFSENQWESRQRHQEMHAITNPPPDAYDVAVANYRARGAADEASEKRRREELKRQIARDEQRLREIRERQEKLKAFHSA